VQAGARRRRRQDRRRPLPALPPPAARACRSAARCPNCAVTPTSARPLEDAFRLAVEEPVQSIVADYGFTPPDAVMLLGKSPRRCPQLVNATVAVTIWRPNPKYSYVAKIANATSADLRNLDYGIAQAVELSKLVHTSHGAVEPGTELGLLGTAKPLSPPARCMCCPAHWRSSRPGRGQWSRSAPSTSGRRERSLEPDRPTPPSRQARAEGFEREVSVIVQT
jgi:hypothetical protein